MPKKIEKDIENRIYDLRKEGRKQKEIAEILGVSLATVGRYCRKIISGEKVLKTNQQEKKNIVYNGSPNINKEIVFDQTRAIKAGLVNNRHVVPVDEFIFDSVPEDKLFDFDWMEETAKEFLLKRIDFINDNQGRIIGSKKLHLYVTGLSSALAAVIKVCSELSINLTLYHFDFSSNIYKFQKIFESFKQMKNHLIGDIFKNNGKVILKDCSLSDINLKEFYLIEKVNFDSTDISNRERDYYICKEYSNFWRLYGETCAEITKEENNKITIFAYLSKIENGNLIKKKFLGKNSNFRD